MHTCKDMTWSNVTIDKNGGISTDAECCSPLRPAAAGFHSDRKQKPGLTDITHYSDTLHLDV